MAIQKHVKWHVTWQLTWHFVLKITFAIFFNHNIIKMPNLLLNSYLIFVFIYIFELLYRDCCIWHICHVMSSNNMLRGMWSETFIMGLNETLLDITNDMVEWSCSYVKKILGKIRVIDSSLNKIRWITK